VLTAAEARALNAEVWSFDDAFRRNTASVRKQLGVKVAAESQAIPLVTSDADYRVGRRMLGLPPVDISLEGVVRPRIPGGDIGAIVGGAGLAVGLGFLKGLALYWLSKVEVERRIQEEINPEIMRRLSHMTGQIAGIQASGKQAWANVTLTSDASTVVTNSSDSDPHSQPEQMVPVVILSEVKISDQSIERTEKKPTSIGPLGNQFTDTDVITYSFPVSASPEAVDLWRDLHEELQTYAAGKTNPTLDAVSRAKLGVFEFDAKMTCLTAFGVLPETEPVAVQTDLPGYLNPDNLKPGPRDWPDGKAPAVLSALAMKVLHAMILGKAMTYREIMRKSGAFIDDVIVALDELFQAGKVVLMPALRGHDVNDCRAIKMFQ
jgi:hypothetical protein